MIEFDASNEPFTCSICYEDYNVEDQIFKFTSCGHKFCKDCVRKYLDISITSGITNLVCLDYECKTNITEDDIQALVDVDLFSKYQRFLKSSLLQGDQNCRWCPYCSEADLFFSEQWVRWPEGKENDIDINNFKMCYSLKKTIF
jgi:hypothetical protein